MGKSYKKPYENTFGNKSRKDKKLQSRKERAMVRALLTSDKDFDEIQPLLPQHQDESMTEWEMSQDGHQMWVGDIEWYKENKYWHDENHLKK